ncbi:MAG TPA: TadE/TadG family type IV pilus assembly protein [Chloroflexaceae bacterium]|nr:TadE/TadG family type IV pilus assembly protein [Chloroflexaceae bacterium]
MLYPFGRRPRWRGLLMIHLMRRARRRGQAMVEFAIVIGLFLMLILGLTCVGQILLANYAVSQAARAAAHQAAIAGGAPEAAFDAAAQVLDAGVGTRAADARVEVACASDPCRRYDPVTVTVDYAGAFWTPLPPLFTGFSVQAAATRAAERDQQ